MKNCDIQMYANTHKKISSRKIIANQLEYLHLHHHHMAPQLMQMLANYSALFADTHLHLAASD
jgi:hypothetical protein